jgi:lipopolysaccharide transport system ATP-binding protein
MSDTVIRINNLGKQYRIGETLKHDTFRDLAADLFSRHVLRRKSSRTKDVETIWALKGVTCEIKKGEVVGIIGRNGAGKSTLLKMLSRITDPTEGRVEIFGRVGSLLEVGTGFHPELTGRENIYLNGAILGMARNEIHKRFDEIVAFAEIEKFLDTPVKRYSSGMYVRLAFAVAAHLEPEILMVDEVLAVGDAAFQRRCLGKMDDVAKAGRTIIFVSHNMAAVNSLCSRAFLLGGGNLIFEGATEAVVENYLQSSAKTEKMPIDLRTDRAGDGSVKIVSLKIENAEDGKLIRMCSKIKITIGYESNKIIQFPQVVLSIYDMTNYRIYNLNSDAEGGIPEALPARGVITCITDPINLTPGKCYVNLSLSKGRIVADYIQQAAFFDVEVEAIYDTGHIPHRNIVPCILRHKWSCEQK